MTPAPRSTRTPTSIVCQLPIGGRAGCLPVLFPSGAIPRRGIMCRGPVCPERVRLRHVVRIRRAFYSATHSTPRVK